MGDHERGGETEVKRKENEKNGRKRERERREVAIEGDKKGKKRGDQGEKRGEGGEKRTGLYSATIHLYYQSVSVCVCVCVIERHRVCIGKRVKATVCVCETGRRSRTSMDQGKRGLYSGETLGSKREHILGPHAHKRQPDAKIQVHARTHTKYMQCEI